MKKLPFTRVQKQINIGILGHANHGKTTLSTAITKQLTLQKANNSYHIINCAEHIDNIRDMVNLTSQMKLAILVVSAPDGPSIQTREHTLLSRQLGVPHLIVFINKVDQVDSIKIKEVEKETIELLNDYCFSDVKIVKGSALKAVNSTSQNYNSAEYSCINELLTIINKILTKNKNYT